jgi:hypothetical protein
MLTRKGKIYPRGEMSFSKKKGSQYIWDAILGGLTNLENDSKNIIITKRALIKHDIPVR